MDDTADDGGGGQSDRSYWNEKAGPALMQVCDQTLSIVNEVAQTQQELNYLRGYIGLRGNGVVSNFVWFSPKPTKKFVHLGFLNEKAADWKTRFEAAGVAIQSAHKRRLRVTLTQDDFSKHKDLIREVVAETVKEHEA